MRLWWALFFVCFFIFLMLLFTFVFLPNWRTWHCPHDHRRCIHGDEINQAVKVYVLRFWKAEVVHRQRCLDCGAALDRPAICTLTGKDIHEQRTVGGVIPEGWTPWSQRSE